jgi:ech hydrogenase subunit D
MLHDVTCVSLEDLVGEVAKIKVQGYRFVTLTCVERDEYAFDIFYHFDRSLTLKHFKLSVGKGVPVPSITPVYFAAFLVENEIQDLFDLRFSGLAIDYERTLYLDGEVKVTPFCKYTVSKMQVDEAKSPPASADSRSTGGS